MGRAKKIHKGAKKVHKGAAGEIKRSRALPAYNIFIYKKQDGGFRHITQRIETAFSAVFNHANHSSIIAK